jgi:hypothetical protein
MKAVGFPKIDTCETVILGGGEVATLRGIELPPLRCVRVVGDWLRVGHLRATGL